MSFTPCSFSIPSSSFIAKSNSSRPFQRISYLIFHWFFSSVFITYQQFIIRWYKINLNYKLTKRAQTCLINLLQTLKQIGDMVEKYIYCAIRIIIIIYILGIILFYLTWDEYIWKYASCTGNQLTEQMVLVPGQEKDKIGEWVLCRLNIENATAFTLLQRFVFPSFVYHPECVVLPFKFLLTCNTIDLMS